ncbi:hypothetical protein Pogu_0789 [Pyrobaculum oguniense TE7]|uniref:Uncharacterized protein n=1 Tax=Pyrobaculum oguniense (strain DSM 13380 / JCM 10595 / TE7) TaxID=698757 RepID=H6Q886_PYROT|nr:hypothetical protein Pogu_0789 [Pyrobaculum oguniense TE7]
MQGKAVVVFVSLAVILGVAFATWTEEATIQVNADTGYIDADFINVRLTLPTTYVFSPPSDYVVVNYMTVGVTVVNSGAGNDGPPELVIDVANMYPGAYVTLRALLRNDGTIPVRVYGCDFTSLGGGFYMDVDYDFDIRVDVDADVGGSYPPFVLNPGGTADVVIYLHAKDDAREEVSGTATFTCIYEQYVG